MANTSTPRTDAVILRQERCDGDIDEVVPVMLARTLERELATEIAASKEALHWYERRMDAFQAYQHQVPEPYRTVICNILANGKEKP